MAGPRTRTFGRRLLVFALLLVLVVVGIGLWRGWFGFSTSETVSDNNKTEHRDVTLRINQDKLERDFDTAVENVREAAGGEKDAETELVTGTVIDVEPAARTLTVRAEDDRTLKFAVREAAEIESGGGPITLASVPEGGRVSVMYSTGEDDGLIASEIKVLDGESP